MNSGKCLHLKHIRFARSVVEKCHLKPSINIAMQNVQGTGLTTGAVNQNYKESIKKTAEGRLGCLFFMLGCFLTKIFQGIHKS